jgi:hypothetical protein
MLVAHRAHAHDLMAIFHCHTYCSVIDMCIDGHIHYNCFDSVKQKTPQLLRGLYFEDLFDPAMLQHNKPRGWHHSDRV